MVMPLFPDGSREGSSEDGLGGFCGGGWLLWVDEDDRLRSLAEVGLAAISFYFLVDMGVVQLESKQHKNNRIDHSARWYQQPFACGFLLNGPCLASFRPALPV